MAGRNGNYYDAHAPTVNLEDITSSRENAIILQKLRDDDPELTFLWIDDDGDDPSWIFVVREGDDLGWLGYFLGGSTTLSQLGISYLPEEKWRSLAFIRELVSNRSIQRLIIGSDLGEGFQNLGTLLESEALVNLVFNPHRHNFETIGLECARNIAKMLDQPNQCNHIKTITFEDFTFISGEAMTDIATALSAYPQLEKLQFGLDAGGRQGSVALGRVLEGWKSPELKDLWLDQGDFDDEGLHALVAGMRNCRNLTRLSLRGNSITANGCRILSTLFDSDHFCMEHMHLHLRISGYCAVASVTSLVQLRSRSLKSLSLRGSSIRNDWLRTLMPAIGSLRLLETLNLSRNMIGNDGARVLAGGLANLSSLEELNLSCTSIGNVGVGALAAGLMHLRSLKKLDLSCTSIGNEGARALAGGLANLHLLEELNLERTSIGNNGTGALAAGLMHLHSLKKLDLCDNPIGDEGISALGPALASLESLESLNLAQGFWPRNSIGDDGVQALVDGISNCSKLSKLRLSGNGSITAQGVVSLSELFRSDSCALTNLQLFGIRLGDDGAAALADRLKGKKLIELLFSSNRAGLTSVGWSAFSKLLCDTSSVNNTYLSNHSLTTIGGWENIGTPDDVKQLLDLNNHPDEHVAIHKILKSHSDFDVEPFFEWNLKALPFVASWFERVITLVHVDDHEWISEESVEAIQSRKLSTLYKFVREMPHLASAGYRHNNAMFAILKRKIDELLQDFIQLWE